jgi:hypothetical protein
MKTSNIISATVLGAGVTALAAAGCGSSEHEPPLTPASGELVERTYYPESGPPVAGLEGREGAIFELTRARCDYEMRCMNVGIDRKYSHLDACKYHFNTAGYDELRADQCWAGVPRAALQSCVQSMDRLSCGDTVDDLDDVSGCDPDDLCS